MEEFPVRNGICGGWMGWIRDQSFVILTFTYSHILLGEGEVVKVETNCSSCGGEKPGGAANPFQASVVISSPFLFVIPNRV